MSRLPRLLAATTAIIALAACSERTPTGLTSEAAFASGSGGGGSTATTTTIALTRPADGVYRAAKGKAKFAAKAGERELQVEVENLPAGTMVTVSIGGSAVGTATADAFGKARLALNSKLGQTVPMAVAGLTVLVTADAGPVVSGSF